MTEKRKIMRGKRERKYMTSNEGRRKNEIKIESQR